MKADAGIQCARRRAGKLFSRWTLDTAHFLTCLLAFKKLLGGELLVGQNCAQLRDQRVSRLSLLTFLGALCSNIRRLFRRAFLSPIVDRDWNARDIVGCGYGNVKETDRADRVD
jgi:hypothetical protein